MPGCCWEDCQARLCLTYRITPGAIRFRFPLESAKIGRLSDKFSFVSALLFRETSVESLHTDPLVVGLAAGDERAFAALYDLYAARLFRAALGMLGRREDAEDAVQEVFAAMFKSSHGRSGTPWVTAVVKTCCWLAVRHGVPDLPRKPLRCMTVTFRPPGG